MSDSKKPKFNLNPKDDDDSLPEFHLPDIGGTDVFNNYMHLTPNNLRNRPRPSHLSSKDDDSVGSDIIRRFIRNSALDADPIRRFLRDNEDLLKKSRLTDDDDT
jgi:hypothetical protein